MIPSFKSQVLLFIPKRSLQSTHGLLLSAMFLSCCGAILTLFQAFGITEGWNGGHPRRGREIMNDKIALFYEQTVALLEYRFDELMDCELIQAEMSDNEEKRMLFEDLRKGTNLIKEVPFNEITSIIDRCDKLDREMLPSHVEKDTPKESAGDDALTSNYLTSVLSGIAPGTKWCGINDIAINYHDLGIEEDLDRCCRTHDHCPIKVKPFQSKYGTFNYLPYTKSHCDCDSKLYNCLKNITASNASGTALERAGAVGNLFFNIMQIQCLEPRYPAYCLESTISTDDGPIPNLDKLSSIPQNPSHRSRRSLPFHQDNAPKKEVSKKVCLKWAVNSERKPKYLQVRPKKTF